jgi:xanthine/uracil permease
MDQKDDGGARDSGMKSTFLAMALGSILAGLMVYLLQAQLGIPEDTARLVSTALLAVGVADLSLLYFWDRIFKRRD